MQEKREYEYKVTKTWTGHSWMTVYSPILTEEEKEARYQEIIETIKEMFRRGEIRI